MIDTLHLASIFGSPETTGRLAMYTKHSRLEQFDAAVLRAEAQLTMRYRVRRFARAAFLFCCDDFVRCIFLIYLAGLVVAVLVSVLVGAR